VYPRITAESFRNKTVRALRLTLGSDVSIRLATAELTGDPVKLMPLGQYLDDTRQRLNAIQDEIRKISGVREVSLVYDFSVPGSFYIPGKDDLQLFLIEGPDRFLKAVYHEDELGVGKPFPALVEGIRKNAVLISNGLTSSFEGDHVSNLGLGDSDQGEVQAAVAGKIHLLPGLSQAMMQGRESFSAASVDFLNAVSQGQPYVVGESDADNLRRLEGSLAGVMVHVSGDGAPDRLEQQLLSLRQKGLIPPFTAVNVEAQERKGLSSDMFVYLALENLKVFMIGGILVAVAGLTAIAIMNFIERKRVFALLRLRGISPSQLLRVLLVDLMAPLAVGAGIGLPVGLVTGYGLTNAICALPRTAAILAILPVRLTVSWVAAAIVLGVLIFFFFSSLLLSSWIFQKTAREALAD
jgi:hypothetical protein